LARDAALAKSGGILPAIGCRYAAHARAARCRTALRQQRQRDHVAHAGAPSIVINRPTRQITPINAMKKMPHSNWSSMQVAPTAAQPHFLAQERALFIRHNGFRSERLDRCAITERTLPQLQNVAVGELTSTLRWQQELGKLALTNVEQDAVQAI